MRKIAIYLWVLLSASNCDFKNNSTTQESNLSNKNMDDKNYLLRKENSLERDTLIKCDTTNYNIIILKKPIKDRLISGEYDNEFRVLIKMNEDTIYNKSFSKNNFKITDEEFIKKATLYNVLFDGIDCQKNILSFFFGVGVPESDWICSYEFYISKEGRLKVYELNEDGNQKYRPDLSRDLSK